MKKTVVLQSHRSPLPHDWLLACLQSVRAWAEHNHFDYRFIGDELFDALPTDIQHKAGLTKVIASDLARIIKLQQLLESGYDNAIWCDADFLVLDPQAFRLTEKSYALGREIWVQRDKHGRLRAFRKVHNAFMLFRKSNAFLDFYVETAQKLLTQSSETVPAQFIGPKLLTALHNIAICPVQETAGMLSPLVITDIVNGGGAALELFRSESDYPMHAANLCSSSVINGQLKDSDMQAAIDTLLQDGSMLLKI